MTQSLAQPADKSTGGSVENQVANRGPLDHCWRCGRGSEDALLQCDPKRSDLAPRCAGSSKKSCRRSGTIGEVFELGVFIGRREAAKVLRPRAPQWQPPELQPDEDGYVRIARDAPDPFVGPCPSWCEFGTHEFSRHPDDRVHSGASHPLPLELSMASDEGARNGYERILDFLTLRLRQGNREVEPHVWLGLNETDKGRNITLTEASRLARTLDLMVALARVPETEPKS